MPYQGIENILATKKYGTTIKNKKWKQHSK
jgi:hypothetical protein